MRVNNLNRFIFIFAAVLALNSFSEKPSAEGYFYASDLHNDCVKIYRFERGELDDEEETLRFLYCASYFRGVLDSLRFSSLIDELETEKTVCPPMEVKPGQAIKLFLKILDENPEFLSQPSFGIAPLGVVKEFDCYHSVDN